MGRIRDMIEAGRKPKVTCKTCEWLKTAGDDQAEAEELMLDGSVSDERLSAALRQIDENAPGWSSIRTHRRSQHWKVKVAA